MATFVSAASHATQLSSSFTVPLPASLQVGDLLIAAINFNDSDETVSPPAGWTAVDGAPVKIGMQEGGVWYRLYDLGVGDPTWTISTARKASGCVISYRGVDNIQPVAVVGGRGTQVSSSANLTAPSVTTTHSSQELIGVFMQRASDIVADSGPNGMTLRAERYSTSGGATSVNIYSQTIASSSATGARTTIYNAASQNGYALLLVLNNGAAYQNVRWGTPLILAPKLPDISYPGQTPLGKLYWGTSFSGNADPYDKYEAPTGVPLGIRRTFYQWTQRLPGGAAATRLAQDKAAGRLSWISFKPPQPEEGSWNRVASGEYDAEIDQMLNMIESFDTPVWLTFNHEPEGGGIGGNQPDDPVSGPAGHVAANARIRQRMSALGTKNIALSLILMSWTWTSASGRNPEDWWQPGIYDFLGIDHYVYTPNASAINATWMAVRQTAANWGTEIAMGEWGILGEEGSADHMSAFHAHAANSHNDGSGARIVALAYWDSIVSEGSTDWRLTGPRLQRFLELMSHPNSVRLP